MLNIEFTSRFKKDFKRVQSQGKNINELKDVMNKLAKKEKLEEKYKDHPLHGNYKGYRDCHIRPDWVLIYKVTDHKLILERTGSHSELDL